MLFSDYSRPFYDKRMAAECSAESLGDEWKVSGIYLNLLILNLTPRPLSVVLFCALLGNIAESFLCSQGYLVRISGGNDKQGFPMKQGVMTNGRVRLLLSKGHSCYRPRRSGERKRKSVRGCIVDSQLSVLNLVIIKKGENEIPGLTDKTIPRCLGPKRAGKIRKMFNLSKEDDVRQYVISKHLPAKDGKEAMTKTPKIQRLVTPARLRRKRRLLALKKMRAKKAKEEKAEYIKLLAKRAKEAKEKRKEISRKRSASSSRHESVSSAK